MIKKAYIDDKAFEIQGEETILQFLKRHKGKYFIPTLCDAPHLKPFGSCRLCTVEVIFPNRRGKHRTVAACHTPIEDNMVIFPHTQMLEKLRKNIVELILTDHPYHCETCASEGNCVLQKIVEKYQYQTVRYPNGANHLDASSDHSHPYLRSNLALCINCSCCVRACDEVQGQFVYSLYGRGFESKIIKGHDQSFKDSDCVACGACVSVCPTQAISDIFEPKAKKANRKVRTICAYCGVGCNLTVHLLDNEILKIDAPWDAQVNLGHTCSKGRYAFGYYNHPDRLRNPLIRKNGELVQSTWDEAYDFIASKLKEIKNAHGSDAIAGISSARGTNEENYLMQKFMRAVIGTNNIDGCARVCHAPTAFGMQQILGTGAATNSIDDIQKTECILIVGANPTFAHPVTGAKLKQAAIKGTNLIVIDPYKTELAEIANIHLQLRPGTNVAVLNMMLYYIITEGRVDEVFIRTRTEGYEEFKAAILKIDIDYLEKVSGVSQELVKKAAILYSTANGAMSFHGLGVTEHFQGSFAVMLVAQLALLTGNYGKPGVGVNPLRGQNNVQGCADMGVQPHQGAGYFDVTDPDNIKKYEAHYGVPMPSTMGLKIPKMLDAAGSGALKALWVIGEDLVQTDPNHDKVKRDLEHLELLVVQDLFLNETAKLATVVLPASSAFEKSGTFTNGERRVQRVHQVIPPLAGTKPDGVIIVEMMRKLGYLQPDYDPITLLHEIAKIVPFFAGITWETLGEEGEQWPVALDGTDTPILHTKTFTRGKGLFRYIEYQESDEIQKHQKQYPFILTTVRDLVHYNCGTMTRRTHNQALVSEDFLLINPDDAKAHNIKEGEGVKLISARGSIQIRAKISDGLKPGILRTTFHFPDIMVNELTSDILDEHSGCPEYKVTAVRVELLSSQKY